MDEQRFDQPHQEPNEPDAGARGGEAAFVRTHPAATGEVAAWAETVIRWSPIWMGLLAAIGLYFVINAFGIAVSLSAANADRPVVMIRDIMRNTAIWNVIAGLIALFVGGFLAGRLGVHHGLRSGWVQGTAVWALYLIAALIGGTVFTGLTGMAGSRAMTGMPDLGTLAQGIGADRAMIRDALSSATVAAWLMFAGIVIAWLAAVLGAWVGIKSSGEVAER